MCGIFGSFLNRPLGEIDIDRCRSGRDRLGHRGPDDRGEWIDVKGGIYLGHTRLSILDLSMAASQPMHKGKTVVAYNGEIYNFRELREDLEKHGVRFQSSGDTEVLIRGWEFWGEEVLNRIDGMFAFALWNGQHAYLCVDAFGEKQLYWAKTKEGIYVSSELGPLANVIGGSPSIDDQLLTAYLSLGYIPAPETAFPQIKRIPPATVLRISNGNIDRKRRFWDPPIGRTKGRAVRPIGEKDLDRIHEALVESLRHRLIADVPVCHFLSGGIDSPLVAALAYRELGVKLECITVAYPRGSVVSEANQASEVARLLDLNHRVIECDEDPSQVSPGAVLDFFGQPNENITVMSVYQLAKAATGAGFKVGLTGMAGDEVFYGYAKHAFFYRFRHLYGLPEWVRIWMGTLARILGRPASHARKFTRLIGVRDCEKYIANKNYPAIDWLRSLSSFRAWSQTIFKKDNLPAYLKVPFFEMTQVMPNSHLIALDVGSMRASLELRTPFLCRKVVETVARFDPRCFMAFGQKNVLRRILARYLPKGIVDQPKLGFVFPFDRFIATCGNGMPRIPGLSPSIVRAAWEKRNAAFGWMRVAVRMVLLEGFMDGLGIDL
jgi:asparagine synthase (glutamine-hydrolysing)